jgi:RimJ/RimL family protein N-acetyltransferase
LTAPERLVTERLVLRRWRESDVVPLAEMNADPQVMRYFPRLYSLEETRARIAVWSEHFAKRGYAPWAVEAPGLASCMGVVGPALISGDIAIAGRMEILWRLGREFWGKGYAVEAARAALRDAFARLRPDEIIAYTSAANTPSRRVMEKLGMAEDAASGFAHPAYAEGHPLRPHVVFRLARRDFLTGAAAP